MKIQSLITNKPVHTISAHESVKYLVDLLSSFHVGALVVSSNGRSIDGIVSERDVVRSMPGKFDSLGDLCVREIMTKKVHTCTPDLTVSEAMTMMTNLRIRHVPVVDSKGDLLSIVSIGDVVKHHLNEISLENQALKDYVSSAQ